MLLNPNSRPVTYLSRNLRIAVLDIPQITRTDRAFYSLVLRVIVWNGFFLGGNIPGQSLNWHM